MKIQQMITQILKNRHKVLGQNARNLIFINEKGNGRGRAIADDKLETKEILVAENVPTPKLLGVIKNINEFKSFNWDALPKSFVIKPVHGVQGGGIEIFYNRDNEGNWIRGNGSRVSLQELKMQASDILDGKYSIKNEPDQVFFEERIRTHSALKNHSYKGTPDIRVIVYNKIPIMAYVRFPTEESGGKANMILGAVGTGIDLANGTTTSSTYGKANGGKGAPIEYVPGTKLRYRGLTIPNWDILLRSAAKTLSAVNLKYGAVDFLLDDDLGPVIVEISARPGLSIQLVNREGLHWRLKKAKGLKVKSIEQGIRLGRDLFGGEIENEIEKISGKEVISNIMPVRIFGNDNKKVRTLALIDTSRRTTVLDSESAFKLGIINEEIEENENVIRNISFKLGNQIIKSECRVVQNKLRGHKLTIGRKDLTNFIIDIKRVDKHKEENIRKDIIASNPETSIKKLDEILEQMLKTLAIIPALKPINLDSEKEKFYKSNFEYNPVFKYPSLKFDSDQILNTLDNLNPPDNEIGELYIKKIKELKNSLYLIESIGSSAYKFTRRSTRLFGRPKKRYIKMAEIIINKYKPKKDISKELTINEVEKRVQKVLNDHGINSKLIIKDKNAPTKASIGKVTGKITLNKNYKWTEDSLNGMIAHEIHTHLVRKKFGHQNKNKIFEYGTAGYLKYEEGLATLAKFANITDPLLFIPALRYLSLNLAFQASFVEVFNFINKYIDDPEKSFNFAMRAKRGIQDTSQKGAFTKDQYFEWAILSGEAIIKNPELLKTAFNGKASFEELNNNPIKNNATNNVLKINSIKKVIDANTKP